MLHVDFETPVIFAMNSSDQVVGKCIMLPLCCVRLNTLEVQ